MQGFSAHLPRGEGTTFVISATSMCTNMSAAATPSSGSSRTISLNSSLDKPSVCWKDEKMLCPQATWRIMLMHERGVYEHVHVCGSSYVSVFAELQVRSELFSLACWWGLRLSTHCCSQGWCPAAKLQCVCTSAERERAASLGAGGAAQRLSGQPGRDWTQPHSCARRGSRSARPPAPPPHLSAARSQTQRLQKKRANGRTPLPPELWGIRQQSNDRIGWF